MAPRSCFKMGIAVYETALGPVTVMWNEDGLTGLCPGGIPGTGDRSPFSDRVIVQLEEYLAGKRTAFDLPLCPQGTPFQQKVWQALRTIPYGQTRSYGEIAEQIGQPNACRAVGMANHANPLLILIPCHRVVGENGGLTGYAAGLELKQRLLELEKQ